MKKQYQYPVIEYVTLTDSDILTASVDLATNEADWILDWSEL